MKYPILLLFICLAFHGFAQFQDDFSDGDFSMDPTWQGDTNDFVVNDSLALQLNGKEEGGISQLSTVVSTLGETTWEFLIELDFAPSSSNFASVYLAANQSDLTGALNAYYLKIGGVSGAVDAVELYQQTGTESTLLISGIEGGVGVEPAVARIRVERDADGTWRLFADYTGGNNFELEGTAMDATHGLLDYFGVVYKYSSSRKDKFFFDDLLIDPVFEDTTPPSIVDATIISSFEVDLIFSEPLAEASIIPMAFNINNNINIVSASLDAVDLNVVHLILDNDLVNTQEYTITIDGVQDLKGNEANNESTTITYIEVQTAAPYDIIINEFMVDPTPEVGLPNAEFIELYNRSDKILNLKDYQIFSGSFALLNDFLLYPDSYVTLCKSEFAPVLASFGDVLIVDDLPALSNDVDIIALFNDLLDVIDDVSYTKSDYGNSSKAEGGWTLERVNPNNPCALTVEFLASDDEKGGTPGVINSVIEDEPDQTPPSLLRAVSLSNTQVEIVFNENLTAQDPTDLSVFTVNNNISVVGASVSGKKMVLDIVDSLQAGIFYTLEIAEISDCVGNSAVEKQTTQFALPAIPEEKDIVINEILFNPETGGSDFVELYNCSDKVFNIKDLYLANIDGDDQDVEIITQDYLLFPDAYVVLTVNTSSLLDQYNVPNPAEVVFNFMPAFSNEKGNVSLYRIENGEDIILDAFDYTEDFHSILLDDVDGVSLERINQKAPTQSMDNWHSAGSLVGYATPTYKNSQFVAIESNRKNVFSLAETTFSPDEDGYKDFLQINYQTDAPGWNATIQLFDARGRMVRTLKSGAILGTEGSIKWDGTMDNGEKAPIGIYVLWIEAFLPDGSVERFKEVCVVAAKL